MPETPVPRSRPHALRLLDGRRPRRTVRTRRLLVDLVESPRNGWTAEIRATGIPALQTTDGTAIHVGWHVELADLIEELRRVLSSLREWWPDLEVRFSARGSTAAARATMAMHGLTLPR